VQADLYEKLGDVQAATGALDGAETSKRQALQAYRALAEAHPADPERQTDYAVALIKLGDLLGNDNFPNLGRRPDALAQYRTAERILTSLHTADEASPLVGRLYGLIYERIGTIHDTEGRLEAATAAYERSLQLREQHARAHPTHTDALRDWAVGYEKMGDVLVQAGDPVAAQARYREAQDLFARLAAADPKNIQAKRSLAISHLHLAEVADHPTRPSLRDPALAHSHYRTAESLLADVLRVDSASVQTQGLLDFVQDRLAQ
jgi:tetratricopeptide (TPR) repeat protein